MSTNKGSIYAGILTILMATSFSVPSWGAQSLAASKGAIKMQKLDFNQLKSLPDDAVIEIDGKKLTKRQLKAGDEALLASSISQRKAAEAKSHAGFEAKRSAFLSKQKSEAEAYNARLKANLAPIKARAEQLSKIQAEATQMNSRYASASPAEKAKMDKRAGELMAELNKLGY